MSQKHPSWEAIVEYVEAPERVQAATREHIAACSRCRRIGAEIEELLTRLAASRLPRPPHAVLQRTVEAVLHELGEERQAAGERAREKGPWPALREVWATLVADSLAPNLAVRGAVAAAPRMLLYEAEGFSITLSLTPGQRAEEIELMGQVIPQQAEALPADSRAILRQGGRQQEMALSPHGEFSFPGRVANLPEVAIVLADSLIRLHLPSDSSEA